MLRVGDRAPYFELESDQGRTISLVEQRGSKVVLYFYPKDNTPGCTREAAGFRDLQESFTDKNTVIFGISQDSVVSHRRFSEKLELNFPLLADVGGRVSDMYGVRKERDLDGESFMTVRRTTFVLDEFGVIQKIYEKIPAEGHPEEVLASV